jgi:hypothetical protein
VTFPVLPWLSPVVVVPAVEPFTAYLHMGGHTPALPCLEGDLSDPSSIVPHFLSAHTLCCGGTQAADLVALCKPALYHFRRYGQFPFSIGSLAPTRMFTTITKFP